MMMPPRVVGLFYPTDQDAVMQRGKFGHSCVLLSR